MYNFQNYITWLYRACNWKFQQNGTSQGFIHINSTIYLQSCLQWKKNSPEFGINYITCYELIILLLIKADYLVTIGSGMLFLKFLFFLIWLVLRPRKVRSIFRNLPTKIALQQKIQKILENSSLSLELYW